MKAPNNKRYALFGAGGAARTILAELPCLRQELGPVAASSLKVATRIANVLQTGYAVRDLSDFQDCEVILVCAPDTGLGRAMEQLEAAPFDWRAKSVVLCVSGVSSIDFPFLVERGASVGSFNEIEGMQKYYVVEGGKEALREAKRLVKNLKGKTLEVNRERMRLFEAATTLSGSLFTPLVDSCVECLRASGIESKEASRLAEKMLLWTLRSYQHSGRRGWTGPVATRQWTAIENQYDAFRLVNRLQAEYFLDSAKHAFDLYESFPELSRYLTKKLAED